MHFLYKYRGAIFGSVLAGFIAHFYILTNILQNYDNIAVVPKGYGTGLTSGRWMLTVLGDLIDSAGGNYNLSFFNGLVTLLLLTLTACLVADMFQLRQQHAFLFSAVFISYPTVTGTLMFMYTATYYALAILLAVAAAWITTRYNWGFIIAIILETASLGIYQAYIPMTATLFVLFLIMMNLQKNWDFIEIVKKSFLYLFTIIFGFIGYFLMLKVCLYCYHEQLGGYVGVDHMGQISITDIPKILEICYKSFFGLVKNDYHGISESTLLRTCFLMMGIVVILLACWLMKTQKMRIGQITICVLYGFIILPLAVNSIEIMCFDSKVYELTVYATVFIYLVPLLFLDQVEKTQQRDGEGRKKNSCMKIASGVVSACLVAGSLNYTYAANINYTAMYYMNQQTTSYMTTLKTRVESIEGFKTEYQWAFVGSLGNQGLHNWWSEVKKYTCNPDYLVNWYSKNAYLMHYTGWSSYLVDDNTLAQLSEQNEVREMPCYPEEGSIRIINDIVVVKFSDE